MGGEMSPFFGVLFHKEQAFSAAGLWTVVVVLLPPGAVCLCSWKASSIPGLLTLGASNTSALTVAHSSTIIPHRSPGMPFLKDTKAARL